MAHVMLIENRVTYIYPYGREEALRICFTLCSIERENPEWNCDYFRQNFLFSKDEPGLISYIQELWNDWIFGSINYFSLADAMPDEVYGIPESRCDYYQTTGISSSFNDATTYSDCDCDSSCIGTETKTTTATTIENKSCMLLLTTAAITTSSTLTTPPPLTTPTPTWHT